MDNFLFQWVYLEFIFLQTCLLSSPLRSICILSKSLNLIGCQGEKRVGSGIAKHGPVKY